MSNDVDPSIIIPLKLRTGTHTVIRDGDANFTHRFIYRPVTSAIHSVEVRRNNTDIEFFPTGEDLDPLLFRNSSTETGTRDFLVEKTFFVLPRAEGCRLFVFSRIQNPTGQEELIYSAPLLPRNGTTGKPNFYLCQLHIEQDPNQSTPSYKATFNATPYSNFIQTAEPEQG